MYPPGTLRYLWKSQISTYQHPWNRSLVWLQTLSPSIQTLSPWQVQTKVRHNVIVPIWQNSLQDKIKSRLLFNTQYPNELSKWIILFIFTYGVDHRSFTSFGRPTLSLILFSQSGNPRLRNNQISYHKQQQCELIWSETWLLSQAGNFKKGKKFGILHKLHLTSCNVRLLDSSPTSTWAWYIKVTEINDYYNLYSLKICMNEHEQWQHPGGGGYLLKNIHSLTLYIKIRKCSAVPFLYNSTRVWFFS